MAADYIAVTKTNRPNLGAQLIRAANTLRELRDLIDALNDAGGHMFAGADYTVFEAQFGVTGGANVLALIGLVNTILNTNTDVTGANRLSQLDEFVARLAGQ
jgi:hypothetical protein